MLTLADRAQRHYTTGITTVRTAAQNREAAAALHARRRARADRRREEHVPHRRPARRTSTRSSTLLQKQGVRVDMLGAAATIRATRIDRDATESRTFPAGTAVVSTRQPLGGLANTLLEKAPAFSKGFVEEQRAKAEADEPDEFYDLTTWSLPLAMNVEGWVTHGAGRRHDGVPEAAPRRVPRRARTAISSTGCEPKLYRFVGRLLESERALQRRRQRHQRRRPHVRARHAGHPQGQQRRRTSTRALRAHRARAGVTRRAAGVGLDGRHRVRLGEDPPREGSEDRPRRRAGQRCRRRSACSGTRSTSTRRSRTRRSPPSRCATSTCSDYEVLVFPDGNYADRLGKRGIEKIKQWVNDGGTIVAVKGANAFLREKDVEISKLKPWEPPKKKDDDKTPAPDERYNDFRIPGSAFRTTMNERSYLTFGVPRAAGRARRRQRRVPAAAAQGRQHPHHRRERAAHLRRRLARNPSSASKDRCTSSASRPAAARSSRSRTTRTSACSGAGRCRSS